MKPDWVHLRIKEFLRDGESYHFAQTHLTPANTARYHDHDYHEVFWVMKGQGEHRWNETTVPLTAGQLLLIRPLDRHCVLSSGGMPLLIVNVAFPSRIWRDVRRRYFADKPDWFELPMGQRQRLLDTEEQARLTGWAERLAVSARPRVVLDGFLMELPDYLRPAVAGEGEVVPEWLGDARRLIVKPEGFSGGTREFARLAGRSPAHLARATWRWFGRTPTDVVNEARMAYSAAQLVETSRPIMEIALDCGLNNLSHFYALFKKRHGMSPRKYRLQAHSTVRA